MRFKGTLALLVMFLGLGAFVYFYEVRGGKERKKTEEAAKKIFHIDKNKIVELNLVYPDKKITASREAENKWKIVFPISTSANSAEWEKMASNFVDIEKEKVVAKDSKDLSEYGLQRPALKVSARLDGPQSPEILFGSENPTGSYVYAKVANQPDVVLIPSFYFTTFKKDLADLRQSAILQVNEFDVSSLSLKNTYGAFDLVRTKEGWRLKTPIESRADEREISAMLSALSTTKAKEFLDANPPTEKQSGLDKPMVEVRAVEGKDSSTKRLVIGHQTSKKNDAPYYAKDAARKEIFLVDKSFFDKLNRPLFDLRDKTIAKFQKWDVDAIEISRGKEHFLIKKDKDEWVLEDNKRKAASEKINGMLDVLDTEKIKDFIDKPLPLSRYGLEPPKVGVVLKKGAETVLEFALGYQAPPKGKSKEALYHFKNKAETPVYLVSKKVLEPFQLSKADLAQKQ